MVGKSEIEIFFLDELNIIKNKEEDITESGIESIIINHSDFIDFEIKRSLV